MAAQRDPKVKAVRDVERAYDTVGKLADTLDEARVTFRAKLLEASRAGVSRAELSRRLGTSESRIRQTLQRAAVEDA